MITGPFLGVDYICRMKICLLWPIGGLLISNLSYIIDIKKGLGDVIWCWLLTKILILFPLLWQIFCLLFHLYSFVPLFWLDVSIANLFFLGESLYCKSCFPFTFLFKLIGQKCQLKRWRVKREKTKSYSVINKHSLNLDEIFNLSRKGTRAKIRWS